MEQSGPKRRRLKFRRRGIIQKKAYNSHTNFVVSVCIVVDNMAAVRNLSSLLERKLAFRCRSPTPGRLASEAAATARSSRTVLLHHRPALALILIGYPCADRLCGLVVRVSGYRYRGLGFDSRHYQIF